MRVSDQTMITNHATDTSTPKGLRISWIYLCSILRLSKKLSYQRGSRYHDPFPLSYSKMRIIPSMKRVASAYSHAPHVPKRTNDTIPSMPQNLWIFFSSILCNQTKLHSLIMIWLGGQSSHSFTTGVYRIRWHQRTPTTWRKRKHLNSTPSHDYHLRKTHHHCHQK